MFDLDPVTVAVSAAGLAVLFVFGVLDTPKMAVRFGGGFWGKIKIKLLSGGVFGLASLAVLVLAAVPISQIGVGLARPTAAVAWVLGILLFTVPVVAFSASRPGAWETSPELRAPRYGAAEWAALVGTWVVYLLFYELFFRGVLTFQLVGGLGVERGLAVMTALYVLAHLTKPPSEALATILAGPLYGWVALQTGGFWPVWVLHIGMSMTSEISSIRANPAIETGTVSSD